MATKPSQTGFQPRTTPAERRAFFEQQRRLANIDAADIAFPAGTGNIGADNVEDAIVEAKTDSAYSLALHDQDTTDAHELADRLPTLIVATGTAEVTSGTTMKVVNTASIPARGRAGMLDAQAFLRIEKSVAADVFNIEIKDAGSLLATAQTRQGTAFEWISLSGYRITGGSAKTITVEVTRSSGTGTATTLAGVGSNNITIGYFPDP